MKGGEGKKGKGREKKNASWVYFSDNFRRVKRGLDYWKEKESKKMHHTPRKLS